VQNFDSILSSSSSSSTVTLCKNVFSFQICSILAANNNTGRVWDTVQQVPYLINGNQWISYDDVQSLTGKVRSSIPDTNF
jgi:GH18 family chitinase